MRKKILSLMLVVAMVFTLGISLAGCGGSSGSSENKDVSAAKEMKKDKFIESCESVDYKELVKNSEKYVGKSIKIEVNIYQADEAGYVAYGGELNSDPEYWLEDEYVLTDYRDKGDKFGEGDLTEIYGVYLGYASTERAYLGDDNVPEIAIIQVGELESVTAIEKMIDGITFDATTDEWGDLEYKTVVENTTGLDFGSFSIDVNFLDADGVNVGSDTVYADNWKDGSKASMEMTFVPDGTVKYEIVGYDYY